MKNQALQTFRAVQRVLSWSEPLSYGGRARSEMDNELFQWVINMRVEVSAMSKLLMIHGVSLDEVNLAVEQEANELNEEFQKRYPGLEAIETDALPDPPGGARIN